MSECALPQATVYETPLGPLMIDVDGMSAAHKVQTNVSDGSPARNQQLQEIGKQP